MAGEWSDFQNLWEARFLDLGMEFLDPSPELDALEGSAAAVFADGATLTVAVDPLAEDPPHSGYYVSEVTVQYNYERTDDGATVSDTWGQILQAYGYGEDGGSPLRDRLRVDPGRTVIPKGIDVIQYNRPIISDPERVKQLQFTAYLGLERLAAS